jgi:hypothetical protein
MNSAARPVSLSLREFKSRRLSPGAYLRELTKLADLGPDALAGVDHIADLRKRIATLEQRVRKLEARK